MATGPSLCEAAADANTCNDEPLRKFSEKVKRCLLLEELNPQVTIPMIQTALGQFGEVMSVTILPNPLDDKFAPRQAIVEMENSRQAEHAIKEIQEHPFMVKGVPRPVMARPAVETLFPDRPQKMPRPKIGFKWVEADDPDWPLILELKRLAKKHAAEANFLAQQLRREEEKKAEEQEEKVKENIKKLDDIINCYKDNVPSRLSRYYGLRYEKIENE